ncbi:MULTISPECIES: ATP-binding cassette domain-containing protein [Campylobacter]|uniref:ABC transporter ATP-binding protein n=1 Tax=Campylobacter porcelli TaxID=1660073 RepID=A0A1X9SXZ0_9BACT|nr:MULTISPECIES: ABC transporter ATP-binding protein [unclassified Campylobacter]MCR8679346.1 ABC transporter ATP-binding protein [Campylobacter sp. RM19072]MCR8696548.1 ABC transporter ATP-binding protein [Campylobacter sp. RM19073]MEE3705222.1 ABC transporter ATP-binding protein [Campylobacter sp. CX2-8023-23]MEE3744892.1 ABC transporter ATP-binding protein [Campylobacter sp. CX2-4855-23]MEE3777248.1 ABC transporter ATP-binding protein [Campylobacter sp. CX2-4080-23]
MIKIENITKKFGSQIILNNINLNIQDSQKLLIMGQNGAGKSTLMKVILGEIICDNGSISIDGIDPIKDRKNALKYLSFVPQTPPPLRLSVSDLCHYCVSSTKANLNDIISYLKELDLEYKKEYKKPFYKLSGGMKQKVLIALALARESKTIMFDEPTANLDPKAREKFMDILNSKFQSHTLIFISHRVSEVKGIVNRIVEMDLGNIIKDNKANNE